MVGGRLNHSTANIQTLLDTGDGHGMFGSMLHGQDGLSSIPGDTCILG